MMIIKKHITSTLDSITLFIHSYHCGLITANEKRSQTIV